eukprot:GHVT01041015.1.p1 GENE.GHVT01041015.1~~GHVT01041015.1.p1  ORF type:complete len:388 (-),score=59.21 GHVT01041015.1:295-1458(-)
MSGPGAPGVALGPLSAGRGRERGGMGLEESIEHGGRVAVPSYPLPAALTAWWPAAAAPPPGLFEPHLVKLTAASPSESREPPTNKCRRLADEAGAQLGETPETLAVSRPIEGFAANLQQPKHQQLQQEIGHPNQGQEKWQQRANEPEKCEAGPAVGEACSGAGEASSGCCRAATDWTAQLLAPLSSPLAPARLPPHHRPRPSQGGAVAPLASPSAAAANIGMVRAVLQATIGDSLHFILCGGTVVSGVMAELCQRSSKVGRRIRLQGCYVRAASVATCQRSLPILVSILYLRVQSIVAVSPGLCPSVSSPGRVSTFSSSPALSETPPSDGYSQTRVQSRHYTLPPITHITSRVRKLISMQFTREAYKLTAARGHVGSQKQLDNIANY